MTANTGVDLNMLYTPADLVSQSQAQRRDYRARLRHGDI